MNILIITAGLDEIRETYFDELTEDDESFPTVNRAGLLIAEFEGTTEQLQNDLLDWRCQHLSWHQTLWYSEKHLAAFLQTGTLRVTDINLFTFADLPSFQAGVAEIKETCRRQR
jgi:hypothetical protein